MKIEFTYNNRQEGFILPVNPPSLEISTKSNNTKKEVISVGEINLIGNTGLARMSFRSFFPSEKSPFSKHATMGADEYVAMIKKWQESNRPIRVIETESGINLAMAIENFMPEVREGMRDIYFTIDLCEYRFLNVPAVEQKTKVKENGLKERPTEKPKPKTYTVKKGDNLWAISKKLLGNGSKYKELYNANKSLIDSKNVNNKKFTIYPGQRLVLP